MASRVGAPINVTFGASFTVPSGANAFIASGIWYDGANQAVTNVSGSRITTDNVAAVASSGAMGVYSVRGRVNSSGSDTWSITKAGFFSEGPTCQVQFYSVADNTNFVRQQQVVGDTSGAITRSVTSTTSDLVDAWIMSDGGGTVSGAISGFTAVGTEQTTNADKSRMFQANSPGASSTSITGPANSYPGLVLVSVYDSGGGGQTVSPGLLTNSSTIYAPTVTRGAVAVQPGLLTNTSTLYAPTASARYTVSPGLLSNSSTLYAPAVVPGAVSVSAPLLSNASTIYAPVVSQSGGSQVVSPGLLTNTSTLYGPTLTVGPVSVVAPLLTNSQTFYGATVQPGQITVSAPLLTNVSTLYAPSVSVGVATISPPLLTNTNTLFAPVVVPGSVTVQPGLLTSTSVLYAPEVVAYEPGVLLPPLLVNESTVFPPTVVGGAQGGGHGFVLIDHEPSRWWKRKPKALPQKVAKRRLERVVKALDKVAARQVEQGAALKPRQVREEIAPLLVEMPGFDWRPMFEAILQFRQAEEAGRLALREIERIRAIEQDDEDVMVLLMSL